MSTGARGQVARLLALVPYLQTRTDVSLSRVARDFGVTPDQVRQDLQVLWMCGLPGLMPDQLIDVDMGAIEDDPDGVVRIGNADFLSRPVRLGSSEATALIVALRALRESSAPSTHEVVDRTLAKLEDATATGGHTPPVEVHLGPDRGTRAHTGVLREALRTGRQARLTYWVPSRDETTERTVDPIALLTSEGRDYLDAWCHAAQARRLFRVDRIHGVDLLETPREAHDDLPPRDLSEGLFAPGPDDLVAVVHLERHARWVADYYPVESTEELADGRLGVRLRVGDPRWLVRLALRLGAALQVVEPTDLQETVRRTAGDALALYGPRTGAAEGDGVA